MKTLFSFLINYPKRSLYLAIVWTAIIFFACFIPGNDVPKVDIVNIDKLVHVVLFGICSLLWGIALCSKKNRRSVGRLFLIFIATVALGILVELIQGTSLVMYRSADIFDVIADAVGALTGILVVGYLLLK